MKIIKILPLIIFPFLLFGVLDIKAQQAREMQPLEVHDFECLQSLQCAQSSQSLKSKGWLFIFDETVDEAARELTAHLDGKNISLLALYDKQGHVIRSKYERKDVALPRCLLAYLTQDNYRGWHITSSEMMIKDFEPSSIRYRVMLENNNSSISEVFDFEFINNLHVEHEGPGNRCLI